MKPTTFHGRLISMIRQAEKNKNYEVERVLKELLEDYNETQRTENIEIKKWKGKSGIKVHKIGDKVIAYKWQKADMNSKPTKQTFEFDKKDISNILTALRLASFYTNEKLTSKLVARYFFGRQGKYYTKKKKPLFIDGKFLWDNLFSSRSEHNRYVVLLEILREWKIIEYGHRGSIKLLKDVTTEQL